MPKDVSPPQSPPHESTTSDRADLIERLKRGESPTWIPNRRLDAFHPRAVSPHPNSPPPPLTTTATVEQEADSADQQRLQQGLTMERPRSALHSGDFTSRSVVVAASPPRDLAGYIRSSPSSFVYKHPTSPLVQSESNDESSIYAMDLDPTTPQRQTLREGTFPYQAHQPRKSLPLGTSPGSRRPSVGMDVLSSSPLQQTSLVGSYEESILRGRMSTTPSKPLDFLAQIGVLGLGPTCKSSLRCPAHVTLPFPAVFYSYASTPHGRSSNDDGPSPYVGQIDLENGLSPPEETPRSKRRSPQQQQQQQQRRVRREASVDVDMTDARQVAKQRRRTGAGPKAPPGGSYRIPEKGQLQIIIKNQNKTAVKLFLVPYDLAGMEPGTKTFIRQRSYSGGPIVDGEAAAALDQDADRPVLRYLVHLHICCPARGRFYLYKSIRVVFANRVPDGKEKLRNEVTLPEPRFTPYKPIRVMHPAAQPATDKAFRRRSSGFSLGTYMGEPPMEFAGFALRARASSVQDRGATLLGRSPLTVAESPTYTSAPRAASFVPLHFARNSSPMMVDGEGLLSQRLRSLGMGQVWNGEEEDGRA